MSQIITNKEVAAIFKITTRAAADRMRKMRLYYGKNPGERFKGGGDPITWDEFKAFYNL